MRELRRQGNLIEGDTVLVEVHPDVAQVLATSDHGYLEDMEKRLQKRIVVKARGSFALEDFELRSPSAKAALEKSDANRGEGGDKGTGERRRKRRKKLGPPAEVEAMLEEEERASAVDPEDFSEDEEQRHQRPPAHKGEDNPVLAAAGDRPAEPHRIASDAPVEAQSDLEKSREYGIRDWYDRVVLCGIV
jgi:hypothetical protein